MSFSIKKILPRTLFGRSLLILVTPVILIQLITTYIFFERHWTKVTDRLAFSVAGEIAMVADRIEQERIGESSKEQMADYATHLEMLVSYEEGKEISADAQNDASIVARILSKAMDQQVRRPYVIEVDIDGKRVRASVQLEKGLLYVSLPQRRLFSSSGYIFLLWMIGTSIVLLAIAILFMRNQIRPIRRLAVVAERFGKGQETPASFKPEGAYEVRQAAEAFLKMRERINRQVQQRTDMLAGVSHDLRTPLTRMKLAAAMMEDTPDREALQRDIDDMEHMVDGYLDFVRGEGQEVAQRVNLSEDLDIICSDAKKAGADISLDCRGDLSMLLRPVAFKRSINNLVSNARKYGDKIEVRAVREANHIVITVDDNGPGIPADKYEDVFKPFYRVDSSRNLSTGGVGLGLPIAKDIILAHGGQISLGQSGLGGVRVTVMLPV